MTLDSFAQAKQLLADTNTYQDALAARAQAVGRLREILQFIVACISFAEKSLDPATVSKWRDADLLIPLVATRAREAYNVPMGGAVLYPLQPVVTTAGAAGSAAFGFLTTNYNSFETNQARQEYRALATTYKNLLSAGDIQASGQIFLGQLNPTAQRKFVEGVQEFHALPVGSDPQGPLVKLRSAIDLALQSLVDLTPLTKRAKSELKYESQLATIAEHLAISELEKIDLILTSPQLSILKQQLSASKDVHLPREQTEALVSQATAFIQLLSQTISLPTQTS